MFLGAYPDHYGIYHGLSADRIRNVVGAVMTAAGIPSKFLPHSTRHAFLADSANRAVQQEAFLSQALMSGRVYELFYKCPIENLAEHAAIVPVVPDDEHLQEEIGSPLTDATADPLLLRDRVEGVT